jgi:hypothetical protein
MAGVQELSPALGEGAACRALGLWRAGGVAFKVDCQYFGLP